MQGHLSLGAARRGNDEALPDFEFFRRLAGAAAAETLPGFRTRGAANANNKTDVAYEPVSEAARAAEKAIRGIIAADYPMDAMLGDQFGPSGSGPIQWVIDPINGAKAFRCGLPVWGTLIGLTINGRATMGMMSQPDTGECFWSDGTRSVCCSDQGETVLKTSGVQLLSESICHTNSPEPFARRPGRGFARLASSVKFTRYGGDCYAFAMLAAGQIDLCVELSLQACNIAALIPVIEAAGGVVTRFDGGRAERGGNILASANAILHEAALRVLNDI
ncbi:inositol monophosphatase [Mesorhizobium sp. M2D.F.Ca.ET.185.01.1.1]|uniref:inositol monophosphatase family protein n=1 Tax=unclassified Mesorhizobium TaxID=325217 RepID=UPI000FCBDEA4|nr:MULTISPECIES: inositol monophosphatase family protein [unclassified Mesorhizobium]TGP77333.1 inositol monophosphatase [bacterium M00.F.Ca.ET.227.01.1.1]TGP93127.1 inositol monophosphatase [bacterium M00.F.Ca.ET.222.01.1.1]TGP96673.1 inositol monophosphatase [bacterium M00.F.Ca.ET.221.01.1.1]TGT96609.1 inositol monophosphatase [bacterium M00.F.Ca.ET.163.01.1.1]TGU18442.1 inositol monophosphatase [bacterium M00.F.Ca.ET.156.01.1.1]TGU49885.1 inositol monophosphatase [bacterium M00.F.Ca.ET.146